MIVMFDITRFKEKLTELITMSDDSRFQKGVEMSSSKAFDCIRPNLFKSYVDTKAEIKKMSKDDALMEMIEEYGKEGIYRLIFYNKIK